MGLRDVPGQDRAKRFLKQVLARGHVPHALLFSGMAGTGKEAMALGLARLLNCLDPQDGDCCERCESCNKARAGHHPDLQRLEAEGAFIKVAQVRELRKTLRYPPFEADYRVVVIPDAQNLGQEAGNALLKILEEPPDRNVFILLVLEPQMLLPTIVSRCCHVRFQPLDDDWIEGYLIEQHGILPPRARVVARLAGGSLHRARWWVEADHIALWNDTLGCVKELEQANMLDFFALITQWMDRSQDLEQDLECLKILLRDLILNRFTEDHEHFMETERDLAMTTRCVSIARLLRLFDHVEQAARHLRQNASKQLTLEGVCLEIKDTLYGKGGWNSFSQRR